MTATAFALGAIGAGVAAGVLLAMLGSLLPGGSLWRSLALGAACCCAVLYDATPLRNRIPSMKRQVNEDWMARYRGWVYGAAFGAQLGVGVATIVTSAAIYAAVAAAFLSGQAGVGAAVGATFGAVRALSLLPARRVHDGESLRRLHRRFGALEAPVRRATPVAECVLALLVIGWVS